MSNRFRDHYLTLAHSANEPEDLTGDYPLDLPDYDWPDYPDVRITDLQRASLQDQAGGPGGFVWILVCVAIVIGSLIYLASLVW